MALALRDQINEAMKSALKAQDKARLGAVRLMMAAIKQREVDDRITLDDSQTISVLEKMVKQRRESIKQYRDAQRPELADVEEAELAIIQEFMPEPVSDAELSQAIEQAVSETGASTPRDMGKVIGLLKSRLAGRADMAMVSRQVKDRLS